MSDTTPLPIEITDITWSPVRGCTKVGRGCDRCYAEAFAERWRDVPGHPYERGFELRLVPEKLEEPLGWKKPRRIAVASMSDLFHEAVPDDHVARVLDVAARAPQHTFVIQTKRAERMRDLASRLTVPPNAWLGVSVEDRASLGRIEILRGVSAETRFVSFEPLLEDVGRLRLRGIHWVIVGGETGIGAREMKEEWALSIRDQCDRAKVPFFFKQWGGLRKKSKGRELAGAIHAALPHTG